MAKMSDKKDKQYFDSKRGFAQAPVPDQPKRLKGNIWLLILTLIILGLVAVSAYFFFKNWATGF